MSKRTFILAALLACAWAVTPAQAAHVSCGDTIRTDATLDSDLLHCAEGLTIGADGVTLDLGGHTIDAVTGAGQGIRAFQVADMTIRNGTISGYRGGLDAQEVDRYSISQVKFIDNETGADCHLCGGPNSIVDTEVSGGVAGLNLDGGVRVARSEIAHNSGTGIQLDFAGGTIEDSVIRNNGRGISVGEADMLITDNRILDNEGAGIQYHYWQDGEVTGNRIERNGTGILDDGTSWITVRDNVVRANDGDGARLTAAARLTRNRFIWNEGTGLVVGRAGYSCGPRPSLASHNTSYRNGKHGIEVRAEGECPVRIINNHVHHNGSDGVHAADSAGDVQIRGNRAEHNGDDGIDVDSRLFGVDGTWSPDGILVAGASGPSTIYLFPTDGSAARELVQGVHPSWSPEGTRLAYQAADGVHVIGADGTGDRFLAVGGAPQWSPAGNRILLQDGSDIYTIDAAGGTRVLLARGTDPEWSPTGDRVVFQRANEVLIVNAEGTGQTSVIEGGNPTWSPDGQRLALTDGLDLVTVRADGTDVQYLTADEAPDYSPDWSPDGSQIAFLRALPGNVATYVVSAGGGPLGKVADGSTPPLWAPDSNRLLLDRTVWGADGGFLAELNLGFNPFVTLRGNVGDRNTDLGIEAVEQVTDGGGNRARGNGDLRQCIGIACR